MRSHYELRITEDLARLSRVRVLVKLKIGSRKCIIPETRNDIRRQIPQVISSGRWS